MNLLTDCVIIITVIRECGHDIIGKLAGRSVHALAGVHEKALSPAKYSCPVLFPGSSAVARKGENALEKKPQKDDKRHNKAFLQGLSFLSQIGVTMAACVLIGVFLGRFIDSFLDTSPWFLLLFSFLGVGAAFKALFDLGGRK